MYNGTIRQEEKPGKFSEWERVDSAGLRNDSSPLSEFERSLYIAGKSDTDSDAVILILQNKTKQNK